ncbi:MAG: tRNA dihydrouridine synthase DusB [Bdellovibrionales bacterium]|nr:tRNA dihydrouridine synthase DusB [Bdellovibrionales bacterium]
MTQEQLLLEMKKNPFLLAPMAAITDRAFRSFMREMGCGIVTTELVSANGLEYASEKTRRIMEFDEVQHPVGIQIFGERLDLLANAAKEVEQMGADFVDLNFGCPVPKVVKKGAGSAILKDLKQLVKVLRVVKSAVSIPVTMKTRTGWDEGSRNSDEVAQIAFDEGMTWLALHGRTRSKGYNGQADWDYLRWVKQNSPLPIIGNGDIASAAKAMQRLEESGCDAVMIGRGCLKNPWIFRESMALYTQSDSTVERDFLEALMKLRGHLERTSPDKITLLQIKKFSAWFSAGYPDSAKFRKSVFQIKDKDELIDNVYAYFQSLAGIQQRDTSHEAFLMGGHG